MRTDKRQSYVLTMALLVNVVPILSFIFNFSSSRALFFALFKPETWIFLIISLLVSITPVLLAESNSRFKNYFGYGIPVLLLLPLPFLIYDHYTCTGEWCGLGTFGLGAISAISAGTSALLYTIGIYAKKWTPKFCLLLLRVEGILLIGLTIFLILAV